MKSLTDDEMLYNYRRRLLASLSTDQYSSRVHCAVRLWFCIHQRVAASRQAAVGLMYLFVAFTPQARVRSIPCGICG